MWILSIVTILFTMPFGGALLYMLFTKELNYGYTISAV